MALGLRGTNKKNVSPHIISMRICRTFTDMGDPEESMELFEEDTLTEPGVEGELSQQVTSNEARLMISKIVCRDFKSYAGVKELGPFHKVNW